MTIQSITKLRNLQTMKVEIEPNRLIGSISLIGLIGLVGEKRLVA